MLSILMPYRPDGGHRDRSWRWLEQRWRELLPDAELVIGTDDGGENPGVFNHPMAINRAAEQARGDVFLIGDADTGFDPEWVREAYRQIMVGEARWVLPTHYRKILEADTERILAGDPTEPFPEHDTEWIGECVSWSGLVVVPRQAFEQVGGYDERFAYWGADDCCFGITMDTLWGPHTRLEGSTYHLWHPAPLSQTYGHERHQKQHALTVRYQQASGDVDAVRAVRFS